MAVIAQGVVDFSSDELGFIDYVKGADFPWFFMRSTEDTDQHVHTHILMHPNEYGRFTGVVNSPHAPICEAITRRVTNVAGFKMKKLMRMAINSSCYNAGVHGDVHEDHSYPHYILLIYLNDFTNGETYIYDEHNTLSEVVSPEKHKFVIFEGAPHAQGFCGVGERRLVFVATFDGDRHGSADD